MRTEFKAGELHLLGDSIDLKIDSKRYVYIKKKTDGVYKRSDVQIPHGLQKYQKEQLLVQYYVIIMEDLQNKKLDEVTDKNDESE